MSEAHEAVAKLLAIALALGCLALLARTRDPRVRRRVLLGLVGLGALGYVNFGGFHTDGSPLHVWDQFHYVLGAKYFPELGYDGIYAASLAARSERQPERALPARTRDLRTYRIEPARSLAPFMREVRARFSSARWAEFMRDTERVSLRDEIFLDHGYLPTPAHVALARLFTADFRFRTRNLVLWALIDFILLGLAGFVLQRAFGLETLAAASLVFGLGYCSRYYWVGGAFLRQDWLVAVLCAAGALRARHLKLAGALLGYAVCVRVFPVLLVLPLAVHALARRVRGTREGEHDLWRAGDFAFGFIASVVVCVTAGCLAGRGPAAWIESASKLSLHAREILPNAIGLRVLLSASLDNLRGAFVDPTTLYDYARVAADYRARGADRALFIAIAVLTLTGFSLRAAWRTTDPVVALTSGVGIIFACTALTTYYGSYFVLLALVMPLRSAGLLLIVNAFAYATAGAVFALAHHGTIVLNGAAVYVPVSLLLLVALNRWLFALNEAPKTAVDISLS